MARFFHFLDRDVREVEVARVPEILAAGQGWLWADFPLPDPRQEMLATVFQFHALAIEDAASVDHPPKVEEYPDYLFTILQVVESKAADDTLTTTEVAFFLSRSYLVTVHSDPAPILAATAERLATGPISAHTPDRLMHFFMDRLVDQFRPFVEAIGDEIEVLESHIFHGPSKRGDLMRRLLPLNKHLLRVMRLLALNRELMNRLARDQYPQIQPETSRFLRDVYDELLLVDEMVHTYRELLVADRETYLALINNRLSSIMKILAGVSVIFLPLNLLAGLYGTNFKVLPGAEHPWGFVILVGLMLILSLGMLRYFRRIRWI